MQERNYKSLISIIVIIFIYVAFFSAILSAIYIFKIENKVPLRDDGKYTYVDSIILGHVRMLLESNESTIEFLSESHNLRIQQNTCSKTCKCSRSGLTQYGRFCGYGYTGCENVDPCDPLDLCCMIHDICVGNNGIKNCDCHRNLSMCAACAYASDPLLTSCPKMKTAAANIIADLEYILPHCFPK